MGIDKDPCSFSHIASVKYNVTQVIKDNKSITTKKIFAKHLQVKEELCGGESRSYGFFINTVSKYVKG